MKGQIYILFIFIFCIGIVAILFMAFMVPIGYMKATVTTVAPMIDDTNISDTVVETTNNIYNWWLVIPIAFIIILILWAYMWSQRRENYGQYYPG